MTVKHQGNIRHAELTTHVGFRELKHGAIRFTFFFPVHDSFMNACDEVEFYLGQLGLKRGRDYHIPAWNKANIQRDDGRLSPNLDGFYVTFDSDEKFIMAKMSWDLTMDET